jgi:hypothetical protein
LQVVLVGEPEAVHVTVQVGVKICSEQVPPGVIIGAPPVTVKVAVAEPALPAASVAVTTIVWLPTATL